MLRSDLVAACAALVVALQEATEVQEDMVAVVSKTIHQGAATTLATAQLQFGKAMNIQVAAEGFLPGSDNNEIDDLIESLQPAANSILAKLNVEQLLHAHLDS
jgi:hypothetical protein